MTEDEKNKAMASLFSVLAILLITVFMFFYTSPKGKVKVDKHYSLGRPKFGSIAYCFELKNQSMDDDLAQIKIEILDNKGDVQSRKEFFGSDFLPGKTKLYCEEFSDIRINGKPISPEDNIAEFKFRISIKPSGFFSSIFGFRKISQRNLILGE